jgi:hypothetical protein
MFQSFFTQRWEFFAPPPDFNERMYYVFINKKDSSDKKIYEAIEPISTEKASNAPFNNESNIMDYILSSSITNINDFIVDENKIKKYQDGDKLGLIHNPPVDTVFSKNLISKVQKLHSFKTLESYSFFIAKKNKLNTENFNCILIISKILIPKFPQRFSIEKRNKQNELIIFKSDTIYNIKKF